MAEKMTVPAPSRVKALRENAGMTRAQAAGLICCTAERWGEWESESGSRGRPRCTRRSGTGVLGAVPDQAAPNERRPERLTIRLRLR